MLDYLSVNSGRALLAFLDALGTDGTINVEPRPEGPGVGDVRRVRYAVHAIPKAGLRRAFLLVGREVIEPEHASRLADPAAVDPLTGLTNRRGLETALGDLWRVCTNDPERALAGILVVDIDHFKAVNDRYGHIAGDEVLTRVARVLVTSVREDDVVARLGGDEFLLAGRVGSLADLNVIGNRVANAVRNLETVPRGVDPPVPVSVSVGGVLVRPGPDCTHRMAIEAADRAMYRAKRAGRDRAEIEGEPIGL